MPRTFWRSLPFFTLLLAGWLLLSAASSAAPAPAPAPPPATPEAAAEAPVSKTVEELAESAKKSVVVVTVTGRDGKQQGLGTGFIIRSDGLIATNHHVIGEARPISIQMSDGTTHPVTVVYASQRNSDLAIVQIDAKDLPALELGDSDALKPGQPIVVLGNPLGLKHSVVSGVVSGAREIEGRAMIQLAIPIEPGNSGGPLLDMQGRVQGIVTMKSLVTPNLGFAVAGNTLRPLLEKPNSIPMARWLTIGALDPKEWTPLFGARWRQRSGRIQVDGVGQGFGGRSLCLSAHEVPKVPFEVAATVKLGSEDGAAGLVFGSDGGDVHYGFYPSGGRVRLTRFDGPDVFSWQVLVEQKTPHYRPGEWNRLKVRIEPEKVLCYVNDQLVIQRDLGKPVEGQVGLGKFRDTAAEFKSFRVAEEIPSQSPSAEQVARIEELVEKISPTGPFEAELITKLAPESSPGLTVLRERAQRLEQEAAQLRKLAVAVHQERVRKELAEALAGEDAKIDLLRAALLIAWLDNDELDVEAYERQFARMATELKESLPKDADEATRLAALNKFLFDENGFHGSRGDYYNRSNSYINEVLDDREGLPITLSLVYMELGRRIDLKIVGIGLPGHFITQHVPEKGDATWIDAYEAGEPLTREAVALRVLGATGRALTEADLIPVTKPALIERILHNLMGIAQEAQDAEGMLRYVEAILAVRPDGPQERWIRAVLRFQMGDYAGAKVDLRWILDTAPEVIDEDRVRELQSIIERMELERQN